MRSSAARRHAPKFLRPGPIFLRDLSSGKRSRNIGPRLDLTRRGGVSLKPSWMNRVGGATSRLKIFIKSTQRRKHQLR